jgi:Fe2+ or Zn2+ uptake regulation protein
LGEQLSEKAKTLGYSQIAHVLEVYGICSECSTETS